MQRALKILSQSYTRSSKAGTGSQMCGNLEAVKMLSGEKMAMGLADLWGMPALPKGQKYQMVKTQTVPCEKTNSLN